MKLKLLQTLVNLPVAVDVERIIAIQENAPRITYKKSGNYSEENKVSTPYCVLMLDGESAAPEAPQGFHVIGTLKEVMEQLGLLLS